jgi:hypothetical protein
MRGPLAADPAMQRMRNSLHLGAQALTVALLVGAATAAFSQENGRIKRRRPTPQETERLMSETVMNDGSLQKGDIVATDHGFLVFEGIAADGVTFEFRPIASPAENIARKSTVPPRPNSPAFWGMGRSAN